MGVFLAYWALSMREKMMVSSMRMSCCRMLERVRVELRSDQAASCWEVAAGMQRCWGGGFEREEDCMMSDGFRGLRAWQWG